MNALCAAVLALTTAEFLPQQPGRVLMLDSPVVAAEGFSRIDELVDLDLDGDLDGAGVWYSATRSSSQPIYIQLSMQRNDGQGRMTKSVLHQILTNSGGQPTDYRSAVGDFDGDGNDDLFSSFGQVLCLSRVGAPLVQVLTLSGVGSLDRHSAMFAADVNGDGIDELVVGDNQRLRVFRVTTAQLQQISITSTTVNATNMAVGDATGDTVPEALIDEGGSIGVYRISTGFAVRLFTIPLPASWFQLGAPALVAGDVDGDGDLDAVLFGATQYIFVERTGPAQFQARAAAPGGPATHLYDFDGDGDLDGCCCGGGSGPSLPDPNTALGQFEFAENIGGQSFAAAWQMPSVGPFHLAGCADMNGDGHKDLVGGRCIYFGPGRRDPLGSSPNPNGALVIDVDDDGDPDVLDAAVDWRNAGDGSFAAAALDLPALPVGQQWSPPQCGDYDDDGDIDLFAHRLGDAMSAMHLLRNEGGGHFVDAGPVTAPGERFHTTLPLRFFDFDGDGDRDLITTADVRSWVWLRNAIGNYQPTTMWLNRYVLAQGDFDGDGVTDLLAATNVTVAEQGYWDLATLKNTGGGTFVQQPVIGMMAVKELGIVDFDGDGDLDLICGDYNGAWSLRVFANDGAGVFAPGAVLADGVSLTNYHSRVRVLDFDQDGRWDVVAGYANYPDFNRADRLGTWCLRQTAPGVFDPVLHCASFGELADSDGDGDLDVVGRHLVRNTTFDGPRAGGRTQYGDAVAGAGGALPTLGATGPVRVGGTLQVHLRGAIGGGLTALKASFTQANTPNIPLPGLNYLIGPHVVLAILPLTGSPGAAAQGGVDYALTLPPIARDVSFYMQAFVLEQVSPLVVTQTQGLALHVGW